VRAASWPSSRGASRPPRTWRCRPAASAAELAVHFAVRHAVFVEEQALFAVELARGERWIEDAVGDEIEAGVPRLREPLGGEAEAVAPGDTAERAAEAIGAVGDRGRIERSTPTCDHARDQRRRTGVRGILDALATAPHRAHRDDGDARIAAHDHRHAVREHDALVDGRGRVSRLRGLAHASLGLARERLAGAL